MAVLSVQQVGHGRRNSNWRNQFEASTNEQMRTHALTWRVVTDDPLDDQLTVIDGVDPVTTESIPELWDSHPNDIQALAVDYEVTETEDPQRWYVTVRYELVIDPTTELAVTRVSSIPEERALEEDKTGAGLTNSAYDPFDPPPTLPESIIVLTVQKNLATIDVNSIEENYKLRTNSVAYTIKSQGTAIGTFAPGKVKLAEFSAEPDFRNSVYFWKTTWVFHVRRRGWMLKLLDAGYREYHSSFPGDHYRTIRVAGQPVSSPALLDGAGRKLAAGGVPVFRTFTVYDEADFTALGLF